MSQASPLLRGSSEGANCLGCPFAKDGAPNRPVFSEFPEKPLWAVVGEGPGHSEVRLGRPFIGPSGEVVNTILGKIGRPRNELFIGNATLCVDGLTGVRLADGSVGRIDMMVKHRYDGFVKSVDVDGSIVDRRVVGWFKNQRGARAMYDVSFGWASKTSNHKPHTTMTEDHPILTTDGWQLARDVMGGMIATGETAPRGRALQVAWGTLLGDGMIAQNRSQLVVRHAVDQIDYLNEKARVLSGFGTKLFTPSPSHLQVQDQRGFVTPGGAWGHSMRALFYSGRQKRIPVEVMRQAELLLFAVWYLDDGSMSHRPPNRKPNAEICGVGFLEEDLRLAADRLHEFGFETKVRDGRIHFGVEATAKFSRAIAQYVPPQLAYKLRPEDRGLFDSSTYDPEPSTPFFDRAESVLVAPKRKREESAVYCLEVEGTHNFVTTGAVVHNCMPPQGSPEAERERAAECCKPRLQAELAQFPGMPVLTLGAVAARALIPKAILDAIDPPDTPKAIRKAQKLRQEPTKKKELQKRKRIEKLAEKRLAKMIKHERKRLIDETKRKYKKRAAENYLAQEIARVQARLALKAKKDAEVEYEVLIVERALKKKIKDSQPKKPRKPKKIKITDIVGTLFDVDVDGTEVLRPLIPGIHPAALLRGGGATIGGSHTPDMAFVNLVYDAGKVDSLARGKNIRLKLNVETEIVDADNAVRLFLQIYREALVEGKLSIDLETYVDDPDRHSALMAYVAKIRVIGFATENRAVSLAWDLLPRWIQSLIQVLFNQITIWFHNGLYDATVFRAYGFIIDGWSDTLLAHHAAFPGNSHRLQVVASQFYGVQAWKSEFRNQEETPEGLARYNAKDVGSTHALIKPLSIWVKRTGTEPVYELDKKMAAIASRMHLAGMPVDRDINTELCSTFSKNVAESRRAVEDIARSPKLREQIWHHLAIQEASKRRKLDPDDFEARYKLRLEAMRLDPDWKWKIGSGKHIAALLLTMGVGLTQMTEAGQISTKKDVLESLVDVPVVRDILTFRENDKLYSTFVFPTFDRYNDLGEILVYGYADEFGRIHPIWNVHRISGRWASQSPVVSNVPKAKWKKLSPDEMLALSASINLSGFQLPASGKTAIAPNGFLIQVGKDGGVLKMVRPNLRRQIRAKPGRMFVGFDFGQLESRIIALLSGDPFLCSVFADPSKDIHTECARVLFDQFDSLDKTIQKQLREQSKPINYGAMYLAQIETLHRQLLKDGHNIKIQDLAKAINKLLTKMAGVVRWQQATIQFASRPPYEIKDFIVGRRRTWPMGNVEGTEAVNFGVQTAGAGIMNSGMARMAEVLDRYQEAEPICQIHDAAVFECWSEDAEALAKDVKLAFEQEHTIDGRTVFFPIDCKIGQSWDGV